MRLAHNADRSNGTEQRKRPTTCKDPSVEATLLLAAACSVPCRSERDLGPISEADTLCCSLDEEGSGVDAPGWDEPPFVSPRDEEFPGRGDPGLAESEGAEASVDDEVEP